jgi:hypothetical protein
MNIVNAQIQIEPTLENGNYVTDGFEYRPLNGNIAAIHSYNGTESNIIIPDKLDEFTVEYIDDLAFTNLSFVTSITLPKGLLEIGDNSFSYNENLTTINIPDDCSLNMIGANSFSNNPKLTSFTITSKVETIRDRVFYGSGITSFEVKNNSTITFIHLLIPPHLIIHSYLLQKPYKIKQVIRICNKCINWSTIRFIVNLLAFSLSTIVWIIVLIIIDIKIMI